MAAGPEQPAGRRVRRLGSVRGAEVTIEAGEAHAVDLERVAERRPAGGAAWGEVGIDPLRAHQMKADPQFSLLEILGARHNPIYEEI